MRLYVHHLLLTLIGSCSTRSSLPTGSHEMVFFLGMAQLCLGIIFSCHVQGTYRGQ